MIMHVTREFFPSRSMEVGEPVLLNDPPTPITIDELSVGIERIKSRRKALGPDCINTTILAALHKVRPGWLLELMNRC